MTYGSSGGRYFIQKTYDTVGNKTIKISNNILTMNANGGLTGNELTSQMKSIQFGSNFEAISPSCFIDVASLLSVTLDAKCLEIGDAAFKNCTSLKYVNSLKPNTTAVVTQIGNEAFRNTGLEDITIQLSNGGSYGAGCGSYAFADNSHLSSVKMERNPYVGEYMFSNCANLKSFSMANSHSYVGRNAFENCVSLRSITFPQNFYWLTEEMFKGCTNLTSVSFQEPSQLRTIDGDVFSECSSLTSITLPSSVSSLEYIDDNFLRGSKIGRVTFNGLANEDIATEYKAPQEYRYSTSCIYTGLNDVKTVVDECKENNIPLIGVTSKKPGEVCGWCNQMNTFLASSDLKTWLASNTKYMMIAGVYYPNSDDRATYDWVHDWATKNTQGLPEYGHGRGWVIAFLYWKKSDGTIITKTSNYGKAILSHSREISDSDNLKEWADSTFIGYERNTEITTIISPSITKFGSSLPSITIVSKTGKEFVCTQDNAVTYTPEERVDKVTTDDFRFGIWYYNARQLKEYADTNNIPVFLEFSSANCEPCKDFKQNTFNNSNFQSAVKQKKCLLCRVELEGDESWSTPNTQPYFCVNSWGDSKISIPQTVYYWKKADGTTVKQAYWYNYRTDPVNSTYQTILSRIDQLTASYVPDAGMDLEKPEIVTIEEKRSFKYANQAADRLGRFFICDSRTRIDTITVDGGIAMEGKTENTLTEGGETTFPSGYTYMWYYPQTDYMYDRQGLIFRVNDEGKIEYLYRFANGDVGEENYERPTDDYSTGTIYEMTQDTPSSSLETLIEQAKSNQSQLNIFKLGSSEESDRIRQLVNGQDFRNYANGKDMLFLIVRDATDAWTANAPLYLKQFQTIPQEKQEDQTKVFEPTTVHDKIPCLMVYEGCSHCTVDGSTIEYQKDNYDLTGKDLAYIRSCIEINSEEEP